MHPSDNLRGITLIELMITLVVLVVLITLAAPSMTSIIENRRLAGAGQAVYEQIQYARTEAIKQSRDTVVVIDSGVDGLGWCIGVVMVAGGVDTCDCQVSSLRDTDGNKIANRCSVIVGIDPAAVDPQNVQIEALRRIHAEAYPTIRMTTGDGQIRFSFVRGTATQGAGSVITVASPSDRERTATVNVVGRIELQ